MLPQGSPDCLAARHFWVIAHPPPKEKTRWRPPPLWFHPHPLTFSQRLVQFGVSPRANLISVVLRVFKVHHFWASSLKPPKKASFGVSETSATLVSSPPRTSCSNVWVRHFWSALFRFIHFCPPPPKNYTSRDPKQLRADGRAQTCQQLVAFCASTRMNQNDAVVNLARVALLHVCCWHASRFSTAPELRLGKRARWRASARA